MATKSLGKDFPPSTAVPSTYFHWPGITPGSTQAVRKTLEENNRGYDIYEKARCKYALGAPSKLLEDTWTHDRQHLATLDPEGDERETGDLSRLPDEITLENWDDPKTLGFKDAYSRYIVFFHEEVARLGPKGALFEYVLTPQANWESKNGHPPPQMMVRMVAGVFHPFIHTGFGIEFRDKVVLAEGLAEAAIHDHSIMHQLFPSNWPKDALKPQPQDSDTQSNGMEKDEWNQPIITPRGVSLFEIFEKFQNDQELSPAPYDKNMMINDRLTAAVKGDHGEKIISTLQQWDLSDEAVGDGPGGWESRLKEIGLIVTLLACATGRKGHPPKIDFFLMHALTSSIFLPAYMAILDPPARRAVLQTYLAGILATAIARGRPKIDIEYLMDAPLYPVGPGTMPKKGESGDCLSDPSNVETRNVWNGIVESSLYATDSHVPKSIRSLVYYSTLMGDTNPGEFYGTVKDGKEVIKGASKLDGSIFVRAAGLVMETMGWCREGQKAGGWTFDPIGYDEVW